MPWFQAPEFWVLVGFHIVILLILVLDLGVLRRRAETVSTREAAAWYTLWVSLAIAFGLGIWQFRGGQAGAEFLTGYLLELSLSVDNLFVFLVVFRYFGVPEPFRHRVLFWGILGALIMRAAFILAGAALLHRFHWVLYIFGAILIYTGLKLLKSQEEELDPGKNIVLRIAKRIFPVMPTFESSHFFVRCDGRLFATPMFLVLLVIESTDVVFALDSIPAIFTITTDTFIVYTSNICAILGLRSLYFLIGGFLGIFRYLNIGLGLVLAFVGVKVIVEGVFGQQLQAMGIGKMQLVIISLAAVASILSISILASVFAGRKEHIGHPPEVVLSPEAPPREVAVANPENQNPDAEKCDPNP